MRKPFIAGNWKMYKTPSEAESFIKEFLPLIKTDKVDIAICPPLLNLPILNSLTGSSKIKIGGQNCYWEVEGAYTGEVSPAMLKDAGCTYCIVGHSERRQYFGETNETVNKKIKALLKEGLKPILCIGEILTEREAGITKEICKKQLVEGLKDLSKDEAQVLTIAYEPVWAIGTGKTASAEQAQDVIHYIRSVIKDIFDEEISSNIRIQYGGSVKPKNVKELMEQSDIDGALVGGASLKPLDFSALVNYLEN